MKVDLQSELLDDAIDEDAKAHTRMCFMALRVAPNSPACQPDWREPEGAEDGFRLGGQVGVVLCHQADERCLQGNTSHDRPGLKVSKFLSQTE